MLLEIKKKKKKVGAVLGRNLGQVRSNAVKKYKEIGIINGLFSNFAWGIHLKAKTSGYRNTWVELPEIPYLKKIRTKFLPVILGQK